MTPTRPSANRSMPSRASETRLQPAAATTPTVRAHAVAQALLVPLAITLLGWLPWLVLPHVDGHDRALVWIAGPESAVRAAVGRVDDEPAFAGGATPAMLSPPGTRAPGTIAPAGCPARATRLHFDVARTDQAQTARAALERIATDAGAVVCASNLFEINRGDAPAGLWFPLATSLALPFGLLLAAHAASPAATAASGQEALRSFLDGEALRVQGVRIPLLCAGVAMTLLFPLPASGGLAPAGALLAMAIGPPSLHEAAFRGWLVPRLASVAGVATATGVSFVASLVAFLPFADAYGMGTAAVAVAASCRVFAKTGSVAACIGVHLLVAAVARGWAAFAM